MDEVTTFGGIVLAVGGGLALAVVATKVGERIRLPAPGIVLVLAALASDLSDRIGGFLSVHEVVRIATVALIPILFDGGMDVGLERFRSSLAPIVLLGLVGTFATAALTAVLAHSLFGFGWVSAWLLGAAVAPTDPAVMFSVLGNREVHGRSAAALEGESGINDPVGIALVVGLLDYATRSHASLWSVPGEFAVELAVGLALGIAGGLVLLFVWRRISLPAESVYPIAVLVAAVLLYGLTAVAHGSGFLAVFVAGLVVGDASVPFKAQVLGFYGSVASLAELSVFLVLGLTVNLASLGSGGVWADGLALAALVGLVIRPLVALPLLLPVRMSWGERAFVVWGDLKGAVPILLAAFTLMAGVDDAPRIYGIVFVVVAFSVFVKGGSIFFVARRLGIRMRRRPKSPWRITVGLTEEPDDVQRHVVRKGSPAAAASVRDLPLPESAWISLVVRKGRARQPRGGEVLEPGDEVIALADPEDEPALRSLFGGV